MLLFSKTHVSLAHGKSHVNSICGKNHTPTYFKAFDGETYLANHLVLPNRITLFYISGIQCRDIDIDDEEISSSLGK